MNTCSTCQYYDATAGTCQRFPPAVIVILGSPQSVQPSVSASNTCGEHTAAE